LYYVEPKYFTDFLVYYTTTYATPSYYTEAPKYYTVKAEYYTTTYSVLVYFREEEPKFYSAPSYYETEAPVYYTTTQAPDYYTSTYAAPKYNTEVPKYYTTKATNYYLLHRSATLPQVTTLLRHLKFTPYPSIPQLVTRRLLNTKAEISILFDEN
jgi:hypothetical protein